MMSGVGYEGRKEQCYICPKDFDVVEKDVIASSGLNSTRIRLEPEQPPVILLIRRLCSRLSLRQSRILRPSACLILLVHEPGVSGSASSASPP